MRPTLLLLSCLLIHLAPAAQGTETLPLEGVRVLASPGTPEGLYAFLPGGRAPEPLAWPLPDGPLLLLGLPRSDPVAADLGLLYGLLDPLEDLGGGYLAAAWDDGHRPIAVILADDPVALAAARFELQAQVGRPPAGPDVDLAHPPADAPLRMRAGLRRVRPRYAVRVLDPLGTEDLQAAATTAIAGRATHLRIDTDRHATERIEGVLRRLHHWGVEPVLGAASEGGASTLRAAGGGDGPRLVIEPWASCWHGAEPPPFVIPTRPWGRSPDVTRGTDGIVVVADRWAAVLLEHAWGAGDDDREEWEEVLLPLLPHGCPDARSFLRDGAAALGAAARRTFGAVPWLGPLADEMALQAEALRDAPRALLVPRVPAPIVPNGRLEEPAWRWAARQDLEIPVADGPRRGELLLLADGRRLLVAIRGLGAEAEAHVTVRGRYGDESPWVRADAAPGPVTELVFDHHDLGGDAHPGRVLGLEVRARGPSGGSKVLWRGALVLGP